jgi:hypothetical protein
MISGNRLGLKHTENPAGPCSLGLRIGAGLSLGKEEGCIPWVRPDLVIAYGEQEKAFHSQQRTSKRITNRIREPAAAYLEMA